MGNCVFEGDLSANKKCDITINGKPVKVILTDNGLKKAYFAKPKNYDVETPHFEEISGSIKVHEHSPDCQQFRVMTSSEIYSGSFRIGNYFCIKQWKGYGCVAHEGYSQWSCS